jgi:tRNA A-37 threonylcarbamoyl transferase component Bud32
MLAKLGARARELIDKGNVSRLTLARTHGDLKRSQVLLNGSRIYLIDWSESDCTWVVHDLVSQVIMSGGTLDLSEPNVPDELSTLFEGLQPELKKVSTQLPLVITLIEIAVRQYVVFQKGRGLIRAWERAAEKILS